MKHLILGVIICLNGIVHAQFGPQNQLTDGGYFEYFVLGDVDGDADNDIIYCDNRSIVWRENEEGTSFRKIKTIYAEGPGEGSFFLLPMDVDLDGDLDIFATNPGGDEVFWFENIEGTYSAKQMILEIIFPKALYSGDFDDDGDLDLLLNCFLDGSYSLAYLENSGGGVFEDPLVVTTAAVHNFSCAVADIDGDGDLDVATSKLIEDQISWNENLGGGVFGPDQVLSGTLDGPIEVRIEDVNGDGDLDILSFSQNDNEIVWYENLGGGAFGTKQAAIDPIDEPYSIKLADIDGDGDKDIVTIFSPLFGGVGYRISWYPNLGDATFGSENNLDNSTFYRALHIDDIDDDGDQDILYGSYEEFEISLSRNLGGGLFEDRVPLTNELFGTLDAVAADMDNDGDLDIIGVAVNETSGLVWIENHGDGLIKDIHIVQEDLPSQKLVKAADMDGDGDIDIVSLPYFEDNIRFFENSGGGVFEDGVIITDLVIGPVDIELVDLNADGNLDILSASSSDNKIAWHENLGGTFGPQVIISTDVAGLKAIHTVDLDGDGDMDVLSASSSDNKVAWYENAGDGTFGPQLIISDVFLGPQEVMTADMDADGDLDVLLISTSDFDLEESTQVNWLENDGLLSFGTSHFIYASFGLNCILPEDFDQDGHVDLVIGAEQTFVELEVSSDQLTWHKNLGDGSFSAPLIFEQMLYTFRTVKSGDMDNDGDLDIISVSQSDCKIAWHENLILSPKQVRGRIYFDENENGEMDPAEEGLALIQIESAPTSAFSYSFGNGAYLMNFTDDVATWYEIYPEAFDNWEITSDSASYHVLIDDAFIFADSLDFGLFPTTIVDDIEATLSTGFPRCSSIVNYWLTAGNIGTTMPSGIMELKLDEDLTFEGANIAPDSIVDGSVYWSYDSLFYFTNTIIIAEISFPGAEFMGDTVTSSLIVHAISPLGAYMDSDTNTLDQVIVCAYDPNDKQVIPAGQGELGNIPPSTTDLLYTVRFQNTGTDTAIHIVIKDQLDPNLEWSTLEPLSSSHEMAVYINPLGELSFTFNNIMLPDSNVNELASHGFVTYRIDLKPDLPLGTSIYNTAHIYFDANPAIITNTTVNTLAEPVGIFEYPTIGGLDAVIYPNPFSDFTTLYFEQELIGNYQLEIVDLVGKQVYLNQNITGNKLEIQRGELKQGMYILSILNADTGLVELTIKLIVE